MIFIGFAIGITQLWMEAFNYNKVKKIVWNLINIYDYQCT